MLISGTFTKAVMYLMLLSDSIIAGHFIGPSGVAGINAITPVTAIVTFFGDLLSTGVGIVFSREVGAMRKTRANEIYSQGLILSIGLGLISSLLLLVFQDAYFRLSGVTGDILENALKYDCIAGLHVLQRGFAHHFLLYADRPHRHGNLHRLLPERPSVHSPACAWGVGLQHGRHVGGLCRGADPD